MKKNLLTMSVLGLAVVSGAAMAADSAVTNGQLTFNWQGVVPTAPVTQSTWAFVDGLNMPFIPGTEQLNIVVDPATKDITATSVKPYDFFIVPVDSDKAVTPGVPVNRATTKSLNKVEAFLSSTPVSNGFVGNKQLELSTQALATEGQVAVNLNGQPLKVGSANPTNVTVSSSKEAHVVIDMNAKAAATDVKEGASLSFVAPVTFAVSI
ncbi:Cro/Cl family transcriptional regulator [Salmonella enterica]|nr:Cro/Cl family transcriptional regulator [Salmonella enterica]EBL7700906.1 Cro/Cl family transcriptional regulator [Salmonella enterica]EDU6134620.1 Cro/Cl family transcriptional regulator [Salmonella enterica subsp. enterica]EHI5678528.1 Cro/Cl family transcriptional regulator [Salmonella enterica]EHO4426204.1 Cro/Cl family transcriptional regulator [Salmonella enterica]